MKPIFACKELVILKVFQDILVEINMSLVIRKQAFCICENKDADQIHGNREADQRLCFRYIASTIPLLPLNTKLQASNHLLWLYSLVCVGPGRKPRRSVFSQQGSYFCVSRSENRINFYPYHAHLSNRCTPIMQTCPCNEHPLTPH